LKNEQGSDDDQSQVDEAEKRMLAQAMIQRAPQDDADDYAR
jgi:hypothetical protein